MSNIHKFAQDAAVQGNLVCSAHLGVIIGKETFSNRKKKKKPRNLYIKLMALIEIGTFENKVRRAENFKQNYTGLPYWSSG